MWCGITWSPLGCRQHSRLSKKKSLADPPPPPFPSPQALLSPAPAGTRLLRLFVLLTVLHWSSAQFCPPGAGIAPCNAVLVLCADAAAWCASPQTALIATSNFATVDVFDASAGTPTAEYLATFHAILVFSGGPHFADAALLGDRLTAFHDQGGGVVVAWRANANDNGNSRLQGAYALPANGYALLDYALGGTTSVTDSLGDVLEPQSPLMTGVASFSASGASRSTAPVVAGRAVVVARWAGGGQEPLVLRGMRGNRTLVELNFYPPSQDVGDSSLWAGNGAELMRNALKYSRCMPCEKGTFSMSGDGV